MTEDSIANDGSIDIDGALEGENAGDGSVSTDSSVATDSTIAADDSSMTTDGSSSVFGARFPEGTGQGGAPYDESSGDKGRFEKAKHFALEAVSAVTGYESQGSAFGTLKTKSGEKPSGLKGWIIGGEPKRWGDHNVVPEEGAMERWGGDRPRADGGQEEGLDLTRRGFIQALGLGTAGTYAAAQSEGDDEDPGTEPPALNETATDTDVLTDYNTPTKTPERTPTETPTPTSTPTPTPVATPRVEENSGELVKLVLPERYVSFENESDIVLGERNLCYPSTADDPEGQVVAAFDSGDVEDAIGESAVRRLEPNKGAYGLDLDIVDIDQGEGYDEEPEYVAQLVGSSGDPVYIEKSEWDALSDVEFHEVWDEDC